MARHGYRVALFNLRDDPGQGRCSITSVGVAEVLCASGSISARPLLDTEGCQFR